MIISSCILQLLIVLIDHLTYQMRFTEIKWSPCHIGKLTCRYAHRINWSIMACIDIHHIFVNSTATLAFQIEEWMVRDIYRSDLVSRSSIIDLELVLFGKRICHINLDISRETFDSVFMKICQCDRCVIDIFDIPDDQIQSVESSVQSIYVMVIGGQCICSVIQLECCMSDTVGNRAHACAQEPFRLMVDICLKIVMPYYYVAHFAFPVRCEKRNHPTSEISHLHHDITIFDCIESYRLSIQCISEILSRNKVYFVFLARSKRKNHCQ